ncbi:type VI secretion system baseplate subunit TssF [Pseudomonas putida CSV86]|uniref:Type VI secretion system baseplate subunit TssF n=1 Tax=Pseudomonas bharatica CSV86 TaxID=1005395 RepID=L1M3E2_9PSED|nr:type VI secretion system baseplate subunit TssF [Pseudomonas bharatica]NNJ18739.1 type VI secretion system baseplate subunit TssF [Pseudomonas bharatica CSV86]
MSLKSKFREELDYLRRLGRVFSRRNPQLARFLGDEASDPDVERLLEGFAFLTARLRLKIEDDFPELTHSLLQLLWPNYLRPLPSATIMQFPPVDRSFTVRQRIARGTRVGSLDVDGVACQFRTCSHVDIYPLQISEISDVHSLEKSTVCVDLATLSQNPPSTYDCDRLDFYLSGSDYCARTLYLWLSCYLDQVRMECDGLVRHIPAGQVVFPGFSPDDALLPYPKNALDGYRVLQEYFLFPRRYFFFGLTGLRALWPASSTQRIRLEFRFTRPMPNDIRIRTGDMALYCAPAVNLFEQDAEPVSLTGKTLDHRVRPASQRPDAYEIFSIDRVDGWKCEGSDQPGTWLRTYQPFESLRHQIDFERGQTVLYYRTRIAQSLVDAGIEHRVSFVRGDEQHYIGRNETVSFSLTCSNRDLPQALAVGDICVRTADMPTFVECRNLTAPTPSYRPVLDGDLLWTLISNLSPTYLSLLSAEPLKAVIRAYDFAAHHDLQRSRATQMRLGALQDVQTAPIDRMFKALPIRGLRTLVKLDQDGFSCEGDLYLFGTVLSHFLSVYASISSFHVLEAINLKNQEHYAWPIRSGTQPLI